MSPGLESAARISHFNGTDGSTWRRAAAASAGLVGQFFDNTWFHPFVSAGLEIVRLGARPYVAAGFKVYVSERAFIRSDVRTSWSSDGFAALAWHRGVGFDF